MSSAAGDHGGRRPDPAWSMSLITGLTQASLDPGYRAAADRRRRAGGPASTGTRSPLLILSALVIGLAFAVAAHTLRIPQAASDHRRAQLIHGIQTRQHRIESDTAAITRSQRDINRLQAAALQRQHDTTLVTRLRSLELATGTVAAHGPGLVLTLDDAKESAAEASGDPRSSSDAGGRLTSTDLQIVVNGLWEAGAEAVSINGQRLTAQTAIRFAGQAILVNFRALQPPYAVTVIGGPKVADRFRAGSGGAYLKALADRYDVRQELTHRSAVQVPAAAAATLAHARTAPTPTKDTP